MRLSKSGNVPACRTIVFGLTFALLISCTGNIGNPSSNHDLEIRRYGGPIARVGMVQHTWQTAPQNEYTQTFS